MTAQVLSKPIKIMHVIPTLSTAGAENFVVSLANEQSKTENVTILVLSKPKSSMFLKNQISNRVKLITLDKKPGMDLSMVWKVYRAVKNETPDIINTHLRSIFYTAASQIFLHKPSFHTIHNMAEKEVGKSYRKLLNILINRFGFIPVSISKAIETSVSTQYGRKQNILIENGISPPTLTPLLEPTRQEIDNYRRSETTQILINIGRISKQKNQSMLIEAFERLVNEKEDIVLLILGDFHEEGENITRLVNSLDHRRIHLLGVKTNVSDYLECSDFFCLSSLHEGLPLTLLEAMGTSSIPVCTPVGGIPDVIKNGHTGFISKSTSTDDFVDTLKSALTLSDKERQQMIENMRKTFEKHYTISRCSKQYIDAYKYQLEAH